MKNKSKMYLMATGLCALVLCVGVYYTYDQYQQEMAYQASLADIKDPIKPEAIDVPKDYSWIKIDTDSALPEVGDVVDGEIIAGVTVTEDEDGTTVIDREWGTKPDNVDSVKDPDEPDANIGTGGGELPLDKDGNFTGEPEEPVAPEPKPEPTPEPKPEPTDTPEDGDEKVDEDGQEWVYDKWFGWIKSYPGEGGMIEVESDAIPGTGGTVGTFG